MMPKSWNLCALVTSLHNLGLDRISILSYSWEGVTVLRNVAWTILNNEKKRNKKNKKRKTYILKLR